MKGYIGIDIPTQPYIAAYLKTVMGEKPIMNGKDKFGIGKYFTVMLTRESNYRRSEYDNKHNTVMLRVYIDMHTFKQRGHFLNETNLRDFNLFVKDILKSRFHFLMDFYVNITGNVNLSLSFARRDLEISDDDWSDDVMIRDYRRYRKRECLPLIYENICNRSVRFRNSKKFNVHFAR